MSYSKRRRLDIAKLEHTLKLAIVDKNGKLAAWCRRILQCYGVTDG